MHLCMEIVLAGLIAASDVGMDFEADGLIQKAGVAGTVTFGVRNKGTTAIYFISNPWSVQHAGQTVYMPPLANVTTTLQPGQSKFWTWNKKKSNGQFVPPGNYRIILGPLFPGMVFRFIDVALTPTDNVTGGSYFPLAVKNLWKFDDDALPTLSLRKIDISSQAGAWYKIWMLPPQSPLWCGMGGVVYPTFYVKTTATAPTQALFRFNRPVGYTWAVALGSTKKMKVVSTSASIVATAGKFSNCTLFYALTPAGTVVGRYWFAKGIGLVRFEDSSGPWTLRYAELKGVDGTTYRFGVQ